jgi:hypothetical protein
MKKTLYSILENPIWTLKCGGHHPRTRWKEVVTIKKSKNLHNKRKSCEIQQFMLYIT